MTGAPGGAASASGRRQVFLHVGTHKTGTTAVQILLDRHAADLEARGYAYPPLAHTPPAPNGHHNFAWEITRDRRFDPACGTIEQLLSWLEHSPHHAILSSEDFEGAIYHQRGFAGFIQRLRDTGRDVTFVVYLRRQADYAESLYQTMVRLEMPHTFEEYAREILETGRFAWREWIFAFDYADLLERLRACSGAGLVVRSYETPVQPPLVTDFFAAVGLDAAEIGAEAGFAANVRPPLFDCLAAFWQNRRGTPLDAADAEMVRYLSDYFNRRGLGMSPELRGAFAARFEASNRSVCETYGLPVWEAEPGGNAAAGPTLDELFSERLLETFSRLSMLLAR